MSKGDKSALEAIAAAFPKVPIDAEAAFGQGARTYLDRASFVRATKGKTWRQLGWKHLAENREALHFLEPEGLAQYLPAFLDAALRHPEETDVLPRFLRSALERGEDDAERLNRVMAALTAPQREAVKKALAALDEG